MIRTSVRRLGQAVGMLVVAVVVAIAVSTLPNHVAGRVVAPVPTIPTSTSLDPGAFARGTCVALAPTHGDRHATVSLTPVMAVSIRCSWHHRIRPSDRRGAGDAAHRTRYGIVAQGTGLSSGRLANWFIDRRRARA